MAKRKRKFQIFISKYYIAIGFWMYCPKHKTTYDIYCVPCKKEKNEYR